MGYQCVRTPDWKYIRYVDLEGMDELYDLRADPYEMTNVIGRPEAAAARERMQSELDRLLRATP
jgi:N-acetylglucosamine-6-sulfatase